ncbi:MULTISPECIES: hypothetical protein [unclassified Oceanobacter]|jgi:hypothetical protein|uniref:hypothetical protein n=1 Tax=unclassified Oceanobacter TaxID=2620260 RepID=UPI0026E1FF69|nr:MULTISPECIES: hypothetical protein [unclassified Oceanobacter]MDO6682939.1 hypothetical protein [Oceanobacter sp. 5_MG-2023]MDP2506130.1 hypothetical protein [Oceanobacter sp. 3_MG-2023]MDP2547327.1 hypothetical protein [Oceanobacter sp. 4_MG-2023]MDP2607453.1 hypothetical protein [Oceanobacter sp. 1_MG-2023]MDP2610721.1 hypothetical protein [Oceanobacter sp. 2_MG-2023]
MTVSILETNIDELIEAEQKKLAELIQAKADQQKKYAALNDIAEAFQSALTQHGVSEKEYYQYIASDLENWIKSNPESALYESLQKHFTKAALKVQKTSSLPLPKLKVGKYRNPATQEVVEKIKRSPKLLDQWIEEYGFAVVRTWKE